MARAARSSVVFALVVGLCSVTAAPASAVSAIAVTAGGGHSCAITAAGGLKCWGLNLFGELGDGSTTDRLVPVDVTGLTSGVAAVTAGYEHTCALTTGGGMKCWGYNGYGQLGISTATETSSVPVDVPGLTSGVVAISAGGEHTCALTSGGGMKCWGWNDFGQLGDGTFDNHSAPTDVSGLTSGVGSIDADQVNTCAVTTGGALKCWGYNAFGQVGDGTEETRSAPVAVSGLSTGVGTVSVGAAHTCAVTTGGAAKCWGHNGLGQVGDGTTTFRSTPVAVSGLSSGVASISAFFQHTCARTTTGGARCWGWNERASIGDGTRTDRHIPVSVTGLADGVAAITPGPGSHACALTSSGSVRCWGYNSDGQLGDGTRKTRSTPVIVAGFSGAGPQPDGSLSGGGPYVGGDIYNVTAEAQTVTKRVARGATGRFTVRLQNDGDVLDDVMVDGSAITNGFRLTVLAAGTNVTSEVIAGTYVAQLAPGDSVELTVKIKVKATTAGGTIGKERLTLISSTDGTRRDAVQAKVRARA